MITRNYDGLDRLLSETTAQGMVTYTHDNADRPSTMTVSGRPAITYGFDNADRLTSITQSTTSVSFAYDISGRRTSVTLPDGIVGTYAYDKNSQVTGITYKLGSTILGDVNYAYDAAGRETSRGGSLARTGLPSPVSTTTYNTNNQLTSWAGATLSYDGNGNLTSDGMNSFVWNARNQLASVNSGASTFQYDAFGRRTSKSLSGTTTSFLYDGLNPVQELQGSTVAADLLSGGLDEVFLRTESSGLRSFLTDRLGSTLALADSSGIPQTQYGYEPFGKPSNSGQTSTNSFEFTGKEFDASGLYYYRARFYHPVFQRFLSEDPLGFDGGDVNLYAFVGNNPINNRDPMGTSIPPIHMWETYNAARAAGYPRVAAVALGVGVALRDRSKFQGTTAGDTNAHAMEGTLGLGGRKQTKCEAFMGTENYIRNADIFGALHAIEDSPVHGYRFWDGGYFGPAHIPGPVHIFHDLWYSSAAEALATEYLKNGPLGVHIPSGCN